MEMEGEQVFSPQKNANGDKNMQKLFKCFKNE